MIAIFTLTLGLNSAIGSTLKQDEEICFLPTYGVRNGQTQEWSVPIHGWIFEMETNSWWRRSTIQLLGRLFSLDDSAAETLFETRVRPFFVDNERGKQVTIKVGELTRTLATSEANGHIHDTLTLPADWKAGHTSFEVVGAAQKTEGKFCLLENKGLSVISDLDDTIKISNVLDHKQLLANTFEKPFEAVPQMATRYQAWEKEGAVFHYVSASPWPLNTSIEKFLSDHSFPLGSVHLRHFRLKSRTVLALREPPNQYKTREIEKILKDAPNRHFYLVGDSGENDPEIYGDIARRFPQQIAQIWIRNIEGNPMTPQRQANAFRDISKKIWEDRIP